ncbi:MAG: hydrolase [Mycobacterium sp.]|jgi:predicted acyl esterase|nr:hydrolase [Mycobacterium sp.]
MQWDGRSSSPTALRFPARAGSPTRYPSKYADIFIRICDVDHKGRSENITDSLVRLDDTVPANENQHITARLSPCAHRLLEGDRLRL